MKNAEVKYNGNQIILIFKSVDPFFTLERDWKKPFTMRKNDHGIRFIHLLKYMENLENLFIEIVNPTSNETFIRKIGNVCFYDGYWLISFDLRQINWGRVYNV